MTLILRVTGHQGSGSTTFCKRYHKETGIPYTYNGGIFREMAAQRGISLEAFYHQLKDDPIKERGVDKTVEILMCPPQGHDRIVEGRMAPFLRCTHPHINILLTVDDNIGIERALNRPENNGKNYDIVAHEEEARRREEIERYHRLYGMTNHFDPRYFDIVLDTSSLTIDEVYQTLVDKINTTEPRQPIPYV